MTDRKIFFTDLDETLLTRQKTMTPLTVDAVERLTDAGHYLAFISGRPLDSVVEARSLLPISDRGLFYIANNGGLIVSAETKEIISEIRLAAGEARYLMKACRDAGIHFHTYTDHTILAEKQTPELTFYQRTIHLPVTYTQDIPGSLSKPPFKCLAISLEGRERLEALRDSLLPWAQGRVNLICSTNQLLEMFPASSGKGAALLRLADHLGVPVADTMSAGDQDNDISMLQAAGFGVAMCNGSVGARAAADAVTKDDNNHDGLVPFLEQFFQL